MIVPELPIIECEVTFLRPEEGGRQYPFGKGTLSSRQYLPHVVVGDPHQRMPIVDERNQIQEEYLGVAFAAGPDLVEFGTPMRVQLALIYYPSITYDKLAPGATFTIRDGGHIVGYGRVIQRGLPA